MSQSLPYVSNISSWQLAVLTMLFQITNVPELPENTRALDLRTQLEHKCKEVKRNRQLRERYRQERDHERETHATTRVQLGEARKEFMKMLLELGSTKAELTTKCQQVRKMEGEASVAHQRKQDATAFENGCFMRIEKAEAERDSFKKELVALHDVIYNLEKKAQPANLKEITLTNRAERLEADIGLIKMERNELLSDKGRLADDLKAARSNIKDLMENMTQIQISSEAKSTEAEKLKVKLKESKTSREMLAQQIKKLMEVIEKVGKEQNAAVSDAKKAKDDAVAHQKSVDTMLKGLDHQSKADMAQFGRLKEQVKTVVGGKAAHVMEQDKEMARLTVEIQELMLENTELREEVRLYKDDGGVMVLD
jgi:chromosome segregation ATPase